MCTKVPDGGGSDGGGDACGLKLIDTPFTYPATAMAEAAMAAAGTPPPPARPGRRCRAAATLLLGSMVVVGTQVASTKGHLVHKPSN